MSRPILLAIALAAILLTIAAVVMFSGGGVNSIGVLTGGSSGVVANKDSLLTGMDYYLKVDGQEQPEGLVWMMSGPGLVDVEVAVDEAVPAVVFDQTGRHYLRCIASGKLVAEDSVLVLHGEQFQPLAYTPSEADTVGAAITLSDASTNVKEREWRVERNGERVARGEEEDFTWIPDDSGTYVVRLRVVMVSDAEYVDSLMLSVSPPPVPEPVAEAAEEEGPSEAELAEREARRRAKAEAEVEAAARRAKQAKEDADRRARLAADAAEAKRRKDEEARAQKAREEASKPPPPVVLGPCWNSSGRPFNAPVIMAVGSPARSAVTWKKGVVELEIQVKEDCRLTGFKAYASASVGDKTGKVTLACVNDCQGANKSKTVSFRPVYDGAEAVSIPLSSMPVMVAGNRYRITIDTGEAELGFFSLAGAGVSGTSVASAVSFGQPESCVLDLVFKK
ncbi:MAG: hypothetical protein IT227_12980 [Flavobacteriales bacterium]|nr:hypothetical protein [Flavobacteriales bacterium]